MQAFQGSRVLRLGDKNVNTMGDEVIATDRRPDEVWSTRSTATRRPGRPLATAPLAAGDSVLVGTLEGKLISSIRRRQSDGGLTIGAPVRSQPVAVNGWIYVGTEDGKLVAIDTGDRAITGWPNGAERGAQRRPQMIAADRLDVGEAEDAVEDLDVVDPRRGSCRGADVLPSQPMYTLSPV